LLLLLLVAVIYELPEQCCCLQGVVWPCALTQCEAAADGQPVSCPDALCKVLNKPTAVYGLQVLAQVARGQVPAAQLLLLLAAAGRGAWGCAGSVRSLLCCAAAFRVGRVCWGGLCW
jgi:hypothetical protein